MDNTTNPQEQTFGDFKSELEKLLSLKAEDFGKAVGRMSTYAMNVNKIFGQGRERMVELMTAVTDATPGIIRLGGQVGDASRVIGEIALASRRNVVATTEQVEQLYVQSTQLGTSAQVLTESFAEVGVGIDQIPKQLDKSMQYVRSIGGNTKQVFADVQKNMEQMNRFQFEGGVQGLTKMAAQASMLRFNMNETFRLAENVLDPEGAVETAAAFQRLGVSAGNLVDPFQLMNQSINDPSGLQNSLADVAKQFTYFDEKTKSFKINPQGVLTLRELEKQTHVSAAEMSKMGVAAAELDQRLSAVNRAGLKIANEEDRQFLANIARIGQGGEYEVQIKDDSGEMQTKKLSEITQKEFDSLIDEQKKGPKTLEEIARSQMNYTEVMKADLHAIREKFVGGIVSAAPVTGAYETGIKLTESVTGAISGKGTGTVKGIREEVGSFVNNISQLGKDIIDPKKNNLESVQKALERLGSQFERVKGNIGENANKAIQEIIEKNAKGSEAQQKFATGLQDILGQNKLGDKSLTSLVEGIKTEVPEAAKGKEGATTKVETSSSMNFGGKITVDINLPQNFNSLDKTQQQKILDEVFNSQRFQQYITNLSTTQNPTKGTTNIKY